MENQELIKQVTEKAEQWLTPAYDAETQAEVRKMLENQDKTELIESFYKDLEFGYTLSLHDALPIIGRASCRERV